MLDFGASELFIIAVLAIIVVGPKELPKLIRSLMGMVRKVREMGSEFQAGVKKMADEVELDAVTRKLNEAGNIDIDAKKKPAVDTSEKFSDYDEFDYDEYDYEGGSNKEPSKPDIKAEEVASEDAEKAAEATEEVAEVDQGEQEQAPDIVEPTEKDDKSKSDKDE